MPADPQRAHLGHCWVWTGGHIPSGYGSFSFQGRQHPAHRISWLFTTGEWPNGQVNHLCRNRGCVRPSHLEDTTCKGNLLDSPVTKAAINVAKTHCPKGHPYTPENTRIVKSRTGTDLRQCIMCSQERNREYYRRKNGVVKVKGQYRKTIEHAARVMGA